VQRTKEEMAFFKRELLNREENFNKRFGSSPNVGVMQVIKPKDNVGGSKGKRGGMGPARGGGGPLSSSTQPQTQLMGPGGGGGGSSTFPASFGVGRM